MHELHSDNLSEFLAGNENVIVLYGATWCGACRMVKPKIQALSEAENRILFIYADAEKFQESRKHAVVETLPTFAAFRNGKLIEQVSTGKTDKVIELMGKLLLS